MSAEAMAAALLPPPSGPNLVPLLRCYARAVAESGWQRARRRPATRHRSPMTPTRGSWPRSAQAEQAGISETLVGPGRDGRPRPRAARGESVSPRRSHRCRASSPRSLIGSVAVTVGSTAAFADRRIRPSVRWVLLGITTLIFTATLLVILDLVSSTSTAPSGAWPRSSRRRCAPSNSRSPPFRSVPTHLVTSREPRSLVAENATTLIDFVRFGRARAQPTSSAPPACRRRARPVRAVWRSVVPAAPIRPAAKMAEYTAIAQ